MGGAKHWMLRKAFSRCVIDSQKLEYGSRINYADFPCFLSFGVGGWPCSHFLTRTVRYTEIRDFLKTS